MFNKFRDFDLNLMTITEDQLINARLYPGRNRWVDYLPENMSILEVGVASGDFSYRLLTEKRASKIFLVDTFNSDEPLPLKTQINRRYTRETHLSFIQNRFKPYQNVTIIAGTSQEELPKIKTQFDLIYLDAAHDYDSVVQDIENSIPLLNKDGILAINDYIMWAKTENGLEEYGVVKATNQFLATNKDWEVIGLALSHEMFFDIYLRRKITS